MLICIRTDADAAIGLGHLRRCLSLAVGLHRSGADVLFAARRTNVDVADLVRAEGFALLPLPLDGLPITDIECDARALCEIIGPRQPDWVVVDHYGLDASWHERVRNSLGCRIAVIDDLADRPLSPDALIDHNFVAGIEGHHGKYAHALTRRPSIWLCGPHFALLGPAYEELPPFEVNAQVRSIGIFLGGTDPDGLSARALASVREVAHFDGFVEIASTSANPALGELRRMVERDGSAMLSVDLPDLRDFFSRHDLQIGAGGGATWERCCVGVPAVTLCVADNQQAVVPALAALGAIATTDSNTTTSIGGLVAHLLIAHDERQLLSQRSRALVDGRGAQRSALAITALTGLTLRPVTMTDARRLWLWRNHPSTRTVSRNAAEIEWTTHEAWFVRRLSMPEPRFWLGQVGQVDVGVIRFDALEDQGHYEVSLFLDPALHGLGLGRALLRAGEATISRRGASTTIHAQVMPGNPASGKLFAGSGYDASPDDLNFVKWLGTKASASPTPAREASR